jgi:hypothetical protein
MKSLLRTMFFAILAYNAPSGSMISANNPETLAIKAISISK